MSLHQFSETLSNYVTPERISETICSVTVEIIFRSDECLSFITTHEIGYGYLILQKVKPTTLIDKDRDTLKISKRSIGKSIKRRG